MCGGNSTVGSNPTGTANGPFVFLTSTVCETQPQRTTPGFGRGLFAFRERLLVGSDAPPGVPKLIRGRIDDPTQFLGALKHPGRSWSVFGRVVASGVLEVFVEFALAVSAYVLGIGTSLTGSGLRL